MGIADKQEVWDLLGRMCRDGAPVGRFDVFRTLIGRLNYKAVSRALSVKLPDDLDAAALADAPRVLGVGGLDDAFQIILHAPLRR